jgi:hypothetical protein
MRTRFWVVAALALFGAAAYWTGCGSDNGETTRFSGDVSSVLAQRETVHRSFALHMPEIPASAYAACAAPGAGATLLFCVDTGTFRVCGPVGADCTFDLSTGLEQERKPVTLEFVDDTNSNGSPDSGEATSTVAQSLLYCNGDQVTITGADVNFTSGVTTATVRKTVDRCTGAPTSTATHAGGTATPTRTGTPATPTPTYSTGASLNEPPSSMLAFLFSAGAAGLLIPVRRSRHRS